MDSFINNKKIVTLDDKSENMITGIERPKPLQAEIILIDRKYNLLHFWAVKGVVVFLNAFSYCNPSITTESITTET